jgi:hypothetical protein
LVERLGLVAIIAEHLSDSRHGLNTRFRLPDLRPVITWRFNGRR